MSILIRAGASSAMFLLAACSGAVDEYTGPAPAPAHATPPTRPDHIVIDGTTKWFAIQRLDLGLDGPRGYDASLWRNRGFDLDGKITTADDSVTSKGTCQRKVGSPPSILADGYDGIDNNFGGHLMQTMHALRGDIEEDVNGSIAAGTETLLLRLDNVGPDDNAGVPGALFVARGLVAPHFDDSDHWPVVSTSLLDGVDLARPKVIFPAGYMRGGVWVSGPVQPSPIDVGISFGGARMVFPIDQSLVTFHVADGKAGTLAGLTTVTSFTAGVTPWFQALGVCPGNATFDQLLDALTSSADLRSDAKSLQDPTLPCDAISIGIGFEARPTGAPTTVVAPPTVPSGCEPTL